MVHRWLVSEYYVRRLGLIEFNVARTINLSTSVLILV